MTYCLKIKGNSGCDVELMQWERAAIVRKSTRDIRYADRLMRQADKQNRFYHNNTIPFISTPKILKKETDAGHCFFDMEYSNGNDYLNFFSSASKEEIDFVIDGIIRIIDNDILESEIKSIDHEIILSKYDEIKNNLKKNHLIEKTKNNFFRIMDSVFSTLKKPLDLPVGFCHGDLTFSNILISNRKIVLIDFLDCFIESPINDIVKIRQDTVYHWSMNFYKGSFDRTKILIIMRYIDKKIDVYFKKYDFYERYYNLFQFINFARILPYIRNPALIPYMQNNLNDIAKELTT